jgi:hypothetical protein
VLRGNFACPALLEVFTTVLQNECKLQKMQSHFCISDIFS